MTLEHPCKEPCPCFERGVISVRGPAGAKMLEDQKTDLMIMTEIAHERFEWLRKSVNELKAARDALSDAGWIDKSCCHCAHFKQYGHGPGCFIGHSITRLDALLASCE